MSGKGEIKPIDKHSVHRICSGQVVLSMAIAAKELIENSLDAGATSIDVRLKDYGSTNIEVADNGTGIDPCNFQALTLKHHTSKIRDFSDLTEIDSFGFRGEALSSLCALGKVGTTVTITDIFSRLPVRHKQLQKNVKKEYAKLLQMIQAYCIISTGVRISCSNQIDKGNRQKVLSTNGNAEVRENFINIFGAKQATQLCPFLPTTNENAAPPLGCTITGLISKVSPAGCGRSSADRQFFFINNRPCDHAKVLDFRLGNLVFHMQLAKIVNEVYRQYNTSQYPVVVMNVVIEKDACDINVTPDKRTIYVHNENAILEHIKVSLQEMFEPSRYTYEMRNSTLEGFVVRNKGPDEQSAQDGQALAHSEEERADHDQAPASCVTPREVEESLEAAGLRGKMGDDEAEFALRTDKSSRDKRDSGVSKDERSNVEVMEITDEEENVAAPKRSVKAKASAVSYNAKALGDGIQSGASRGRRDTRRDSTENVADMVHEEELVEESGEELREVEELPNTIRRKRRDVAANDSFSPPPEHSPEVDEDHRATPHKKRKAQKIVYMFDEPAAEHGDESDMKGIEQRVNIDVNALRRRLEQSLIVSASDSERSERRSRFHAKITPSDNTSAEDELNRIISKDSFAKMKIHGQFNLGFIIASLANDLFIIDQHATDEKYNFETLQRTTKVQSQKLIAPKPLDLTSPQESILLEHLEVFEKNGFEFVINESNPPGRRVALTTIPHSKNTVFGVEDVEELIFILGEHPDPNARPSRVRKMFAMRACRSSVMIGKALNKEQMSKLVRHMGEIEQPWNCPHGRPTMRHLVDLSRIRELSNNSA